MDRFEPNLRIPGPTAPAADRPRGRRPPDDQSPGPGVRRDARADPGGHEALLRHDLGRRDDLDGRAPAASRRRSSTRSRRATACSASRSARSATGSPRSPGSTGRTSPSSTPSGATPPRPTRSARSCVRMPGRQGRAADPQRDLDRRHEPDPRARRGRPRGTTRGADPRRQRVGPRRGAVRDGRLGRRRRGHRLAEGLDVGAGAGHGRGLAAGLDRDGDARRCRASTSTSARIARATPPARRRSRRRSRSSTRSTRACG